MWPVVGIKFKSTDRGLVNERLEHHREKQAARSEKARESARHRWGTECVSHANASTNAGASGHANALGLHAKMDANPMLPDPDPDPDPIPNPNPEQEPNPQPASAARKPRSGNRSRVERPPKFHQQVIDLYHEICPGLPSVKGWSVQRRQALEARIAERLADGRAADTLEYWRQFFGQVADSDFLSGRSNGFRASLEWLLAPRNFLKVIEGNYVNRARGNGAHRHG